MNPVRQLSAAVACLAFALAVAAPAASQTADLPQHVLTAASEDAVVRANLFAFCRSVTTPQGPGSGLCGDGLPAATNPRLPIRRGASVVVAAGVPTWSIAARYATAAGEPQATALPVAALNDTGRLFAVQLPTTTPLPLLLVSITYRDVPGAGGTRESGDASFSIGLAERVKARPDAVTALPRSSCRATRIRSWRCRLTSQGVIRLPAGSAANCSGGRVRIQIVARGRRVLRATAPTFASCRYKLTGRAFALRAGVRSFRIQTRFLGTSTVEARSAGSVRIALAPV